MLSLLFFITKEIHVNSRSNIVATPKDTLRSLLIVMIWEYDLCILFDMRDAKLFSALTQ